MKSLLEIREVAHMQAVGGAVEADVAGDDAGLQRLVEPGEGLVGSAAVRGRHRLIQAVPVPVLVVSHRPVAA